MSRLGRFVLKYLYVWGVGLLSMGLVMGSIGEQWWPVPGLILILGSTLVGVWLCYWLSMSGWWQSVRRRILLQSLALVVFLIALNSAIVPHSWRLDLTENQLFTLSSQTQQLVKSLPQPLKVWVFDKYPTAGNQELLINYSKIDAARFSYEFADAQSPIAQRFAVQGRGEVHLEFGSKKRLLHALQPGEFLTESQLTAGIKQIISDRQERIYFLQGHGEPSLQGSAMKALQAKNYLVKPLILAQTQLPPDAALLAIVGARKPLLPAEVQAIDRYLSSNGRLLLLVDPTTKLGLDSVLQKWGIRLSDQLAIDQASPMRSTGLNPRIPIVTDYGQHPITQNFGNGISFYPEARPLLVTNMPGVRATPILTTGNESWSESQPDAPKLDFNQGADRRGPLILGVAASKSNSRLVAIGNSQFIRDGIFEQQLNGDVFLNAVGWLSERSANSLAVRPKEVADRRIDLSFWQSQMLFWLPIVVLPAVSLSMAGFLWWQRR